MKATMNKVSNIIDAAKNSTEHEETLSRLENIQIYHGWADSYEDKVVVVSNWNNVQDRLDPFLHPYYKGANNIMRRLENTLSKFENVDIAWDDMTSCCDDCGRAINTEPSHAFWIPNYTFYEDDGSLYCHKCDPPEQIKEVKEDCMKVEIDSGSDSAVDFKNNVKVILVKDGKEFHINVTDEGVVVDVIVDEEVEDTTSIRYDDLF